MPRIVFEKSKHSPFVRRFKQYKNSTILRPTIWPSIKFIYHLTKFICLEKDTIKMVYCAFETHEGDTMQNSMKILGLTAIVFTIGACAPHHQNSSSTNLLNGDGAIVGGTTVADDNPLAKSIVTLTILDIASDNPRAKGCTGTLIDSNIVLTAAHCIPTQGAIWVGFSTDEGSLQGPKDPRMKPVQAVEVHPLAFSGALRKQKTNDYDLALLQFQGSAPAGYKPVQFFPSNMQIKNGQTLLLAGYGYTDGVKRTTDQLLRQTTVKVAKANFSATEILVDQTKGQGACHGDSGGPAFALVNGIWMQFGVLSKGYNDPKNICTGNSIYTSINAHLTWILQAKQRLKSDAE